MKRIIVILVLSFPCLLLFSQQPEKKQRVKSGFGVTVVQVQPEFPGGPDSLQSFLKNNLKYPDQAKINKVDGRVYVGFAVDFTGKVGEPKILSGVNEELNAEAVRVVKLMPDWKPGTAGGSPVTVQYILPIDFVMPEAQKGE